MLLEDPGHGATGKAPRALYARRKVLARVKSGEELLRLQAAHPRKKRSTWLTDYLVGKYGQHSPKQLRTMRRRAERDMQEFLKSTKLGQDAFGGRRMGPQGRRTGVSDQYRFRRGGVAAVWPSRSWARSCSHGVWTRSAVLGSHKFSYY